MTTTAISDLKLTLLIVDSIYGFRSLSLHAEGISMPNERRRNKRFSHQTVIWFGESTLTLRSGTMVDLVRNSLAFVCAADCPCPQTGQRLIIQLGLPPGAPQESHDGPIISRTSRVFRVNRLSDESYRIAVHLDQPFPGLDLPHETRTVNALS